MPKTKKSTVNRKKRCNKCSKSIPNNSLYKSHLLCKDCQHNRNLNKTKKRLQKSILQTLYRKIKKIGNTLTKYKIYKGGSVLLEILQLEKMNKSLKYINENDRLLKTLERAKFSNLVGILVRELIRKTSEGREEVDNIILEILILLYNQTITDPPYYVSHALDHSIRVTVKMFELLKTIPELNTLMMQKYNDSKHLLILFAGLLHDVGYSDLVYCLDGKMNAIHNDGVHTCGDNKGIPTKKKFLHAVSSKFMTEQNFHLDNLFNEKTIRVLLDSIKEHNFDVNECQNRPGQKEPDSCSFKPTEREHSFYITSADEIDGIIHRDYIEADIQDKPLLFALRIADNLDFEYSRLTNVQQDENLMIVQRTIFMNSEIKDGDNPKDEGVLKTEIERLRPSVPLDAYNSDEREIMTTIINSLKKNEFLFNYSNWIVEKAELIKTVEGEGSEFIMRVKFRAVKNADLDARNESNYKPAVYQITRCAESFSSLKFESKNLTELITVELIYADGTKELKRLKDFE
jgi:hypothetical protein